MIWGAIIVAAGRGTRFGRPKQLVEVAEKPLVAWSIEALASLLEVADLVIATEGELVERMETLARTCCAHLTVRVVPGGATRQESVRNALDALDPRCSGVMVHDGARPLVRPNDIRSGMRVVRPGIASILAAPVVDTIKTVDERGRITRTLDRTALWAAQTPQFATARDLRRAHAEAKRDGVDVTDDAALLERIGVEVLVVPSSGDNPKVTVPEDLARVESLLRGRGPQVGGEREILLVESYVPERAVDEVCAEIERRGGTVDGIERELPNAVVVRAYVPATQLRDYGLRLYQLGGEDALFTTHFSHVLTAQDA